MNKIIESEQKTQVITPEQISAYSKEFSEEKFTNKLKKMFKHMGEKLVYNVLLLYYTMQSKDVPFETKALIVAALGYLICPIDIIPDAVPFVGFTDDLGAILAAVKAVSSSITPEIEAQAKEKTTQLFNSSKIRK